MHVSTLSLHKKIEIYKTAPPVQEEGKIQMGKPMQPSCRPAAKRLTVPSLICCTHMETIVDAFIRKVDKVTLNPMMQTRRKGPATTFLDKDTIAIEVVNLSESTRAYAEV